MPRAEMSKWERGIGISFPNPYSKISKQIKTRDSKRDKTLNEIIKTRQHANKKGEAIRLPFFDFSKPISTRLNASAWPYAFGM